MLLALAGGMVVSCGYPSNTSEATSTLSIVRSAFGAHLHDARPMRVVGGVAEGAFRSVAVRIPSRASEPMRLDSGQGFIEVREEGALPVVFAAVDNALVFHGVDRATDRVHVLEDARIEELRVLRSPEARRHVVYDVRLGGSATSAELVGERVEIRDARGQVLVASEPMFAVDAHGVRRAVHVTLDRSDGRVRVDTTLDDAGLAYPIVVDPSWTTAGSLSGPRSAHVATLLPDGRVLVAGGASVPSLGDFAPSSALTTAEIYDPASSSWSATGSMAKPHFHAALTVLADSRILVTGNGNGDTSAEIYDPGTKAWSLAAPMKEGRGRHISVRLATGEVFVAGGYFSSTAEVYNPSVNVWTLINSSSVPRFGSAAAVLPGGKILVVGGVRDASGTAASAVLTTEIFDPATRTWSTAAPMEIGHMVPTATTLPDGRVLVLGGSSYNNVPISDARIYDPATNTWSSAISGIGARRGHTVTLLTTGKLLIAGDTHPSATAQLFDLSTLSAVETLTMVPRGRHTATMLKSGGVLLAGGDTYDAVVSSAQIYTSLGRGVACTTATDCESGFCVDGVCCGSACTSTCSACDVAGMVGTCSPVASGAPHGARTCGSFACVAGACATGCTSDAECTSDTYCLAGSCAARKTEGGSCSAANECTSGFCTDGVCCNVACTGTCQACGVGGVCTTATGAPRGARSCSGATVGVCGPSCNGVDALACHFATPMTACGAASCTAGVSKLPGTCNGAGACTETMTSCGAYACGATACKTFCSTNTDCATAYVCKAGVCVAGASSGTTCATNDACASGHCVDGVCCDTRCDATCAACDVPGKAGACSPVVGDPRPSKPTCDDGGTDVCKKRKCDGVDITKCAGYVASVATVCKPATCEGSTLLADSTCDGAGACKPPAPRPCAPYACASGACRTTCAQPTDCDTGYACVDAKCVPQSQAAKCSNDGLSVVTADKTESCGSYRCVGDRCRETCTTSAECAPSLTCNTATKTCEALAATGDDGGCRVSAPGARGAAPWLAFLGLSALVAYTRRRR